MNIGIDARLLERPTTGIGRYVKNLVQHIPECDTENRYILFSYRPISGFAAANMKNTATVPFSPRGIWQKVFSPLWLNIILPYFIKKEKIDIFFSPNHFLPWRSESKKNVIVIHDVFHKVSKEFHPFWYRAYVSWALPRAARKSDLILTNSECSKRDIVRYLGISGAKVNVIYHAVEERCAPRTMSSHDTLALQKKYNIPDVFIFYAGMIEERKNISGIIHIADLLAQKTEVPILLVGRPGYRGEYYLREIATRKNMQYLGTVSDKDIPFLYNLASVFLFPSWYEGFGLPPLEAMQSGVPVVASDTSSLPEVIGNGGILLPPDDAEEFARVIMHVLRDKGFAETMAQRGILQAKKFSYKKMTEETVAVFRSLIDESPVF